jgi:acetyl/propionyl-CoA carboxylase alpha subunit
MQRTHYKAFVNSKDAYDVAIENKDIQLIGTPLDWNIVSLGNNHFHILSEGKSYDAYVVNVNQEEKIVELLINNKRFIVKLKDRYDELLEKLGMSDAAKNKLSDLKSPMPGMVLKILVKEGDQVTKGDSLIVLEAMKMENMLKAQGNGLVKSIKIKSGDAVDKGALLISF